VSDWKNSRVPRLRDGADVVHDLIARHATPLSEIVMVRACLS